MEEEILEKLLKKGIGFEKLSHPAVFTSEEAHLLSLPHREAEAKNLFVKGKGRYFIFTVPPEKRVDLKAKGKAMGLGYLSFAREDEMKAILGLTPGSVTPMGILFDRERKVTLVIDSFFKEGLIYVHLTSNTSSILIKASDLKTFLEEEGCRVEWGEFQEERYEKLFEA